MDSTPQGVRSYLLTGLLIGVVLALLGGGIVAVARYTASWSGRQPLPVAFEAIDSSTPPGMTARDFLIEVQYLGAMPDQLDLREEGLARKLAEAFALHPWVEQVERVHLTPRRGIEVSLRFRKPVLAVRYAGQLRAVDRQGVLLPAAALTAGLPIFEGRATPPGTAGQPWGDEAVQRTAREIATLARGGRLSPEPESKRD